MPIRIIVFNAALLVSCIYALRRGGAPERWTAWMIAGAAAATALRPLLTSVRYQSLNPAVLSIDILLLLGLTYIAARADRFWPIWVAAFQLIALAVHLIKLLDPTILPGVYNQTLGKIAYPIIALLVIGTTRHFRRSQSEHERDWSPLRW